MKRIVFAAVAAASMAGAAFAEDLSIVKDQSKVVKLTGSASTIVVGNPAIADVTMQDGNTAFVTGKGFGSTNIIAMDGQGRQIASFRVFVTGTTHKSVKLMKGSTEVTLSCSPRCEQAAGSESSAPAAAAN